MAPKNVNRKKIMVYLRFKLCAMRKYIHPDTVTVSEELDRLLCDSLTGEDIEDFTQSENIDW